jgi:hypothetical protein
MLLFMFIGIFDMGFLLFQQQEVESAADAGALYAFAKGASGFNATNVGAAVTAAAYPTQTAISATPTPYTACACPNGSSGLTVATCGRACPNAPNGVTAATYAVVSAQVTPTPIFNWPGYPSTVNAAVVVRLP